MPANIKHLIDDVQCYQTKPKVRLANEVECDEAYGIAGYKGQPVVVKDKQRKGLQRWR